MHSFSLTPLLTKNFRFVQGGPKKVRKTFVLYSVSSKIYSMKFGPHMLQHHEIITRSINFQYMRHSLEKGS